MGQARGRACVRAGTSATSSPPPPSRRGAATAAMAAECVPAAAGSANRLEPSDATTTCSRGRPPTSRRSAPGSQEPADLSAQIAISPPSGPYTSDAGAVSCAVHTSSPVYGWRRCSVLCGPARMPARRGRARVTARAPGRAPAARHVGRSWAARLRSLPAHAGDAFLADLLERQRSAQGAWVALSRVPAAGLHGTAQEDAHRVASTQPTRDSPLTIGLGSISKTAAS